ncbi:hypothetical protein Tco_0105273 [Tanacetum coccineum]
MAELDSFLFLEWPVLESVGALEDPPLVATLLDTEALEEDLGALNATSVAAEKIANMWLVKRGPSGSGVGVDMAYPRHKYAVSSLMDTAYWLSE